MKKIMCFTLFVFIATIAWSQELHVASGGALYVSPKSYVYVNDNIEINGSGDLIVASDATDSGSLLLSGTATGDISYQRYIPTTNWHFVSAPVTTQDIGTFATNAANNVAVSGGGTGDNYGISIYDNANDPTKRWRYYTKTTAYNAATTNQSAGLASSAGNFISGKGYSNLRSSTGDFTFKGNLTTTNVTITVPDNPATAENHHWGVVGNPYPAFLAANTNANASNVLTQNSGILKSGMVALYFWDGAAYQAVNNSDPALYIAPGQGFVVEATANNQTFTFSKALQQPQPTATAPFYRAAPMASVTLYLAKGETEKKTRLRYLDNNVTTGLDEGYDAGSYRDGTPTFSIDTHLVSNSTGMDFTIQCLPKAGLETTVVPVAVYAKANDALSFRVETENLPEGVFVFLEDKKTNTVTKISNEAYTITASENLNGIGRFYIHTAQSVLSIEDINLADTINMYKTSNSNLRISGLQQEGDATVKMYNITGKEVLSRSFKMQTVNDVALPRLSTGVYLVHFIAKGVKEIKKIIIE